MKIFVPTDVARSAAKMGLGDEAMRDSISRAERGLIDAQIGAFLIKQRVPRRGAGRSGGFRTILAYRRGSLAVFLHLFAKNTTANLTKVETEIFQRLATTLAHMNDETIERIAEENGWKRLHDENGSTRLQE